MTRRNRRSQQPMSCWGDGVGAVSFGTSFSAGWDGDWISSDRRSNRSRCFLFSSSSSSVKMATRSSAIFVGMLVSSRIKEHKNMEHFKNDIYNQHESVNRVHQIFGFLKIYNKYGHFGFHIWLKRTENNFKYSKEILKKKKNWCFLKGMLHVFIISYLWEVILKNSLWHP